MSAIHALCLFYRATRHHCESDASDNNGNSGGCGFYDLQTFCFARLAPRCEVLAVIEHEGMLCLSQAAHGSSDDDIGRGAFFIGYRGCFPSQEKILHGGEADYRIALVVLLIREMDDIAIPRSMP